MCIRDRIHVPLAVAKIRIGQSMKFFRKNLKALGEQRHTGSVDGNLARLRFKHFASDAHEIADIHLFKIFVEVFADTVSRHVGLYLSLIHI